MNTTQWTKFICISLLISIPSGNILGKFSFGKVSSLFKSQPYEETIQKKYTLEAPGTLIIENIKGDIEISTQFQQKTVFFSATKKAAKKEILEDAHITITRTKQNALKISSNNAKVQTDYQLIVPANLSLQLSTQIGSIKVKDTKGKTVATTKNGSIATYNTSNSLHASVKKNGKIEIHNATGPVNAQTAHGPITIHDAKNNVVARTKKGKITTNCANLPKETSITLHSDSGTINLGLPKNTNATILGTTKSGTVTSDHLITLKPQTTKLNHKTWNKFKKEVDGVLGDGQSTIKVSSTHGNIKITDIAT